MFDTDYQITVMQSQHQGFSINGSKETTQVARAPKGQPLSLQIDYSPEWLEADEATVSISLVESGIVVQELRLTGQGLAPSAVQSVHAESQIAVESVHELQFRSAFQGPCRVRVDSDSPEVFSVTPATFDSVQLRQLVQFRLACSSRRSGTFHARLFFE